MTDRLHISELLEQNKNDIAYSVFLKKYAMKDDDGYLYETSIKDMNKRLANELAKCDSEKFGLDYDKSYAEYIYAMDNNYFSFAGRILYALGNKFDKHSTLSNCYVLELEDDSISGIGKINTDMMNIMKMGGGVGFDISKLRPSGSKVNNSAKTSSGPISFMDIFSVSTGTIAQESRRGALILTLSIQHPSILEFIKIKSGDDKSKISNANISIRISDEFMQLVSDNRMDTEWETSFELNDGSLYKTSFKVGDIWHTFVHSNWKGAEPGLLFWDNIINNDPAAQIDQFKPVGTNPCFPGDTLVAIDGKRPISIKSLKMVRKNFNVWSAKSGEKKWEIESQNAIAYPSGERKLVTVILSDGSSFKCTPDHRLALNDGKSYVEAKDSLHCQLVACQNIYSETRTHNDIKVTKIQKHLKLAPVYDLSVDNNSNFYIIPKPENDFKFQHDAVLVHNCAEQPLENYGACVLGSLLLHNFVDKPFLTDAHFNYGAFYKAIEISVRGLDNIVELNKGRHPLDGNEKTAIAGRRIGLGVTGLADALAMMGIKYDTQEALNFVNHIMLQFNNFAIEASIDLAVDRGPCGEIINNKNSVELDNYYNHHFFNGLAPDYKNRMKEYGIRNIGQTSIAPAGCQVKETEIRTDNKTDNGILSLNDLFLLNHINLNNFIDKQDIWFDNKSNIKALTRNGYKKITKLYINGLSKTKKIKLKNGDNLELTHNHKLLIIDEIGNHIWKTATELKTSDKIVKIK